MKKKRKHKWCWWNLIPIAIIICLSVGICQAICAHRKQAQQIKELSTDLHVQEELAKMERDMRVETYADLLQAKRQLHFYENYIGLVNEYDNRYHTYGCEKFNDAKFWAYNIDQAEQLGYCPCSKCR